jgi:hypothetical protein
MANSALFAAALLLPISAWAQSSGTSPVPTPAILTGQDSIIPVHTPITVRIKEPIMAATDDNRMYSATVDRDVADTTGRVTIPKGSDARIMVQRTGTNLSLDLAAVTVDGQTYALIAGEAPQSESAGATHGSRINVAAETVLTFRLDNPIMLLVPVK